MVASISEVKRKVHGRQSQLFGGSKSIIGINGGQDDDLINLNKNKFMKTNPEEKDLQKSRELVHRSIKLKRMQSKQYRRSQNLKLCDYLTLTSLTKRSKQNNSVNKQKQKKSRYSLDGVIKIETNAIDTVTSIKVVREQTKKQLLFVQKQLERFLQKIEKSKSIKSDEESLVFMCNVLHIFEDNIAQSVAYAQQLIAERKRERNIFDGKPQSKFSSIRLRKQRLSNRSKISMESPRTASPRRQTTFI